MSQTIPYVRDLRVAAATIAAQHITACWRDSNGVVPYLAIEAALDAATPFLVDAFLIEEALATVDRRASWARRMRRASPRRAWRRAGGNPYSYLQELHRQGGLSLRTMSPRDGSIE